MSTIVKTVTKAVGSVFASVKGMVSAVTRKVGSILTGKGRKRRAASRKAVNAAKVNMPRVYAKVSTPPVYVPMPPVAPAQMAGKKMRAKNLRGMRFYKPSRKAVKKGRKASRRH